MKDFKTTFYLDGNTTVCLLTKDGEVISRGISVKSELDEWDEGWGKKNARSRAMESANRRMNCAPIKLLRNREIPNIVPLSLARDRFGTFKGMYKPRLSKTERMLLGR